MSDLLYLRADQVGSLVRPEQLRQALARHREGTATADDLRSVQDEAILDVVRHQERLGFPVVGDGEFRRSSFADSFADVSGLSDSPRGDLRLLRNRPLEDFRFVKGVTERPVKVTLLSIDRVVRLRTPHSAFRVMNDSEFVAQAIGVQRRIVGDLVAAGCRYLQMDGPGYAAYTDPRAIAELRGHGLDPLDLLRSAAAADAAVLEGFEHVTFAMHLCHRERSRERRGELAYDGAAEVLFECLPHQRLLIECDADRMSFEALRFVPPHKVVVLGLVSTMRPEIEAEDTLLRRIDDACRYLSVDQLAISTQCGFAPYVDHDQCTDLVQWRKLELAVRVAERVWGSAATGYPVAATRRPTDEF